MTEGVIKIGEEFGICWERFLEGGKGNYAGEGGDGVEVKLFLEWKTWLWNTYPFLSEYFIYFVNVNREGEKKWTRNVVK